MHASYQLHHANSEASTSSWTKIDWLTKETDSEIYRSEVEADGGNLAVAVNKRVRGEILALLSPFQPVPVEIEGDHQPAQPAGVNMSDVPSITAAH